ncbi:uncharacterized protein LOC130963484 [Arachis stenosperma]|uniref:uncharacterized protein LOC130963484 n=1 Tax=Arachis stenosperma TaxID=217475 RepID=UPI0025AC2DE3|nr:uncharacterized protein LOC130963484 [Arachis stenosperma]
MFDNKSGIHDDSLEGAHRGTFGEGSSRGGFNASRGDFHDKNGLSGSRDNCLVADFNLKEEVMAHMRGFSARFDKGFRGTENNSYNSYHSNNSNRYVHQATANLSNVIVILTTVDDPSWYPDSGATHHMTSNPQNILEQQEYGGSEKVVVSDGSGLHIHHVGKSILKSNLSARTFLLSKLLHVPNITKNILNVYQFCYDNGVYFEFHANGCYVKSQETSELLLQRGVKNGLYKFFNVTTIYNNPQALILVVNADKFLLWHARLGHANNHVVATVLRSCNVPFVVNETMCYACCIGKSHQLLFPISEIMYQEHLELVYSDIWGPAPISDSYKNRYFVNFIDACTKDLQAKGIIHRFLYLHVHQQNGNAERKHRQVVGMGLTLLAAAGYKCLTNASKVIITRHVVFSENIFPVKDTNSSFAKLLVINLSLEAPPTMSTIPSIPRVPVHINLTPTPPSPILIAPASHTPSFSSTSSHFSHSSHLQLVSSTPIPIPISDSEIVLPAVDEQYPQPQPFNSHPMVTRAKAGIHKLRVFHAKLLLAIHNGRKPWMLSAMYL